MKKISTALLLACFLGFSFPIQAFAAGGDFVWAKRMGGTAYDEARSVVIGSDGSVYVAGSFSGTADFDPGAGTSNMTSAGSSDAFVAKLDSSGGLVWAKQFGGTGSDYAYSAFVDSLGSVYIGGEFSGTADFDPGVGTSSITSAGSSDAFVAKLDSSGGLVWAKQFGGIGTDGLLSLAKGSDDSVYLAGSFRNTVDFDPGAGTFNMTAAGSGDGYVAKLDSSGGLVWAKQFGGSGLSYVNAIALDSSDNLYATGEFYGTSDFDPGAGSAILTTVGSADVFTLKLDSSGGFAWAKQFGSVDDEYATSIAADSSGNAYVLGGFYGTTDFDPGAGTFELTTSGSDDVFVVKLDSSGAFAWAKSTGGTDTDFPASINVGPYGDVYASGYFRGTSDFDPGVGTANKTSAGSDDAFVFRLDASGAFGWAKQFGGTGSDSGYSLAFDSAGDVYLAGGFAGLSAVDFDPGAGTSNMTSAGSSDAFVVRLELDPDSVSPTVSFSAPADAATVSGTSVSISATASDNGTVSGVQFAIDGTNQGAEDTASPYAISWDSTGVSDGSHTIRAVARDSAGNYATSTITVTVSNPAAASAAPAAPAPGSQTAISVPSLSYAELRQIFGDRAVRVPEGPLSPANAVVPAAPQALAGVVQIVRAASQGTRSLEVSSIQKILNSDPATRIASSGAGSPGKETLFFGPATRLAVQRFQLKWGIVRSPLDSGFGMVGPKTRAKLNEIADKAKNKAE